MAYIEFTRTSPALHYKGLNVHKVGALQVTPALIAIDDLKDYGGTPARYNAEWLWVFGWPSDSLGGRVTIGRRTPE